MLQFHYQTVWCRMRYDYPEYNSPLMLMLLLLLLFSSSLWLLLPLFEFEHQSLQARRVVGPVTTRERDDMVVTEVLSSLSRELLELESKFSCLVRSRRARSRDDRGGVFSSSPPADSVPDPVDPPPPYNNFSVSVLNPMSPVHRIIMSMSAHTTRSADGLVTDLFTIMPHLVRQIIIVLPPVDVTRLTLDANYNGFLVRLTYLYTLQATHLCYWTRVGRNCNYYSLLEVEVEVNLRPTVSRPVRLGIGPPYGTLDQIFSCSSFFC
jgi:hypothetical protein